MATDRQKAYANINHFLKRYKAAYGTTPPGFNRHALAHGFESMALDYPGIEKEIVDFYFENWDEHNPTYLVYNYGKVVVAMEDAAKDEAERREARKRTIERMKLVTDSSESHSGGTAQ